MTVTIDQINAGIIKYIDNDIGARATGFTKFAIYFVAPSIPNLVTKKVTEMQQSGMFDEMFDKSGNIELDVLKNRLVETIKKSGKVYIQQLNYFADEQDIEMLYNYIKGA